MNKFQGQSFCILNLRAAEIYFKESIVPNEEEDIFL